jgi:hypothetical protein
MRDEIRRRYRIFSFPTNSEQCSEGSPSRAIVGGGRQVATPGVRSESDCVRCFKRTVNIPTTVTACIASIRQRMITQVTFTLRETSRMASRCEDETQKYFRLIQIYQPFKA